MLTLLTIVCTVGMAQDETVWKSLSFPDDNKANNKCQTYAKTWTAKIGDDSWSVSNFNNNNWNWTYIKCGSKNNASVAAIVNDVAYTETVTKVVVKIKTASSLDKVNSVRLITASDKKCNNIVETIDGSFGSNSTFTGDLTFNVTKPAKNLFYKFVIDIKKATNGIISISGVDYYISNSETSTPPTTTTTFGINSGKTFTFTNGTLEGFTTPKATATKSDDNTDLSKLIEYTSDAADIVAVDSKTGELTFTNTKFGKATITATLPKTDTYQTSTDSYVVENIDNHTATSLSFNGTDITLTDGKTDAGTDFTGYTATEANNIAGTITYAASGDAVATVNPTTGAVTINAAVYGTTTITATFTPADPTQYSGSTATYQITNKKAVDLSEIVFDVSEDKVSGTSKLTLTKSIVKINTSSGALGKYTDYRFYKDSKTTFSLTDPTRVITSIKFVGGSAYGNFTTDKPNYDKTTGTWTGYEESVKFTAESKVDDVTQIIVTTAEKKTAPALSFAEATVTKELKEEIIGVQALTKPEDLDASAITYTSSDKETAEVSDGMIYMYKTGEATITATSAATDKYAAGTASYKLLIEDNRATDTNFKFAAESYSEDLAEATDGIVRFNAANVLQNPNNLKITYTISPKDENVEIDASTGNVIISKRGIYTITATGAANNTYKETTATCTLKVINSAVEEVSIEFVAGVDNGTGKDSDHAQNEDEMHKSFVKITSDNAWFDSTQKDNYRFYAGTHTISTKIGKITKIEFVGNNIIDNKTSNPLTNLTSADNNYTCTDSNNGVWVGSAKEVVFTNSKQARATNIIVTVEVPKAKSYTLDETKTDNVIETYENANVTLQRTLSKDYWNTFCVPFALDAKQVTQYFGEGTQLRTYEGNCNNNIVYFATVDNIEAGKPYIMKPGNAVVTNPTFEGVSMVATGLDENGNPQAVGATTTVQMKGIYNQVLLRTDKTELFLGDNDLFYYPINNTESRTIGGLRAYFIVPQGTDIKKLRANLDGTPTSLGTIFDTEESNAPVYNLQGQYVGNSLRALKSGIYIQNGKKVAVK